MNLERNSGARLSVSQPDGFRSAATPPEALSALQSDAAYFVGDGTLADSLYRVGPGDVFQLYYETSSVEKQVTPEGVIVLNRIGVVP